MAEAFPRLADMPVGAAGAAAGTTAPEAADSALEPTALAAWTVKV